MTKQSKCEYINALRPRYRQSSRPEQSKLLDEGMKVCGFHRKYLIKVLNKKPKPVYPKAVYGVVGKTVGRPKLYDHPAILPFLKRLWHATEQSCGKRLKFMLPDWLPWYGEATGIELPLEVHVLLTRMSAATIDRLLASERRLYRVGKGRATTKPGTLLKRHIPIKTDQWNERRPGFLEVDTVAHCGMSTAGQYVISLNGVDLASEWTEARAAWGKGERGVLQAFQSMEEALPFPLRGFDSDNGSEFLNHHMHTYLRGRKRQVQQTRSREYQKNDNAHIEQKNWTHIRQTFGYQRFDNPDVVELMNDVYANEYSLLRNLFLPSVKLIAKERIGSKTIKRHDAPQTPCQRLLSMRSIPEQTKQRLRELHKTLNPFMLSDTVHKKVHAILAKVSLHLMQSNVTHERGRLVSNKKGKDTLNASVPTKRTANQQAGRLPAAKTTKNNYKGK